MPVSTYQIIDLPLSQGDLTVSIRRTSTRSDSAVLFLPGLLGIHKVWLSVIPRLPSEFDALTIDFAGRGGSSSSDSVWGIDRHVADTVEAVEWFGYQNVIVVGYSFGAFVGCRLAELYPSLVSSLVVVDGGLTLNGDLAAAPLEALQTFLGPSWERLNAVFPDYESCLSAWRSHPSFSTVAPNVIEQYLSYSVAGAPPHVRYRANIDSIMTDGYEILGDGAAVTALARIGQPTELVRSEHRQVGATDSLIDDGTVAAFVDVKAELSCLTVPGTDHVSLPLGALGADAIAASVQRMAART